MFAGGAEGAAWCAQGARKVAGVVFGVDGEVVEWCQV